MRKEVQANGEYFFCMVEQLYPTSNPEQILQLKDELLERWHQLPSEHQASLGLVLLNEVMQGEWGEWLRNAIQLRHPISQEVIRDELTVPSITQDDLHDIGMSEADIAQLSKSDLTTIANMVREHLAQDVFWDEVRVLAEHLLDRKGKA